MRNCTCKICNRSFVEDDSSPGLHYSAPSSVCRGCETYQRSASGAWLQKPDGEYYQKGSVNDPMRSV